MRDKSVFRVSTRLSPTNEFPSSGLVVDANVLVRAYKCDFLDALPKLARLYATGHVRTEFNRGGPGQKAAFRAARIDCHAVVPGSREWTELSLVRGGTFGVRDLGEDESIALCLAEA